MHTILSDGAGAIWASRDNYYTESRKEFECRRACANDSSSSTRDYTRARQAGDPGLTLFPLSDVPGTTGCVIARRPSSKRIAAAADGEKERERTGGRDDFSHGRGVLHTHTYVSSSPGARGGRKYRSATACRGRPGAR